MRHLILATGLLALAACNNENELREVTDPFNNRDLQMDGWVCDPDTNTRLEGAAVYTNLINDQGQLYATVESVTDSDGHFVLDRLAANYTYKVYVQYGTTTIDIFDVEMADVSITLPEPDCAISSEMQVAVITGDYDAFDEVLQKVGISSYDTINGLTGDELVQFLKNTDGLAVYDAIFFAGGHIEEDVIYDMDGSDTAGNVPAVLDSLRTYVDGGGRIYASDWSYDVVERAWPDRIDFLGDDGEPDAAQLGTEIEVWSTVTDGDLEAAVGANAVEIVFDLDAWPVIEDVGDATVYMRSDVPYRDGMVDYELFDAPILVGFEHGAGKVYLSSWRQAPNADGDALKVIQFMVDDLD